jgi:hypothetical protein
MWLCEDGNEQCRGATRQCQNHNSDKNKCEIVTIKVAISILICIGGPTYFWTQKKLKKSTIFNPFFNKKWSTYFGIRQHPITTEN